MECIEDIYVNDRHCVVVNDNQFIARTSRKEICGDRDSRSGVAYDIDANKVGYIITRPNKEIEITYFEPTMKVNNVNDFVAFVETFKQAEAKYSYYYSYYDWVQDIIRMKEGLEHIVVDDDDDDEFIFARDDEFIRTTSDAQINKTGYNGLVYKLHKDGDEVGYIITYPNKRTKVIGFEPKMEIRNPNDFVNLVKTFKQTCSKHKNYNYYNLSRDIMEDVTTEDEGPIKEIVINGNNMDMRMYYYKNKEAVVKAGTISVGLRYGCDEYDISSIKFENVNDFTAFVEGIIPYCTANNLNFNNYINSDYMLQHLELQKEIAHKGEKMKAKVLVTSFCYPGNVALAYYDNKTTMLISVKKFMKDFVGGSDVPVKLDKDFQTAEEFQQWIEHSVKPYCQEHKTGYVEFVDELNKQYDEKHKSKENGHIVSTRFDGKALLVYCHDIKKTRLLTDRDSNGNFYERFFVPVKLDKDFQTAEEFQNWVSDHVDPYCQEHKTGYIKFVKRLNKQYDEKHKSKKNRNDVSTRFDGKTLLAYYHDIKKTRLLTDRYSNGNFNESLFIPVKLDKDFQTAEEFQNWVSNHVDPYCQEHKTGYVEFVDELNKQYDEKHKDDLLTLQLDEAQIELVSREYDKSTSDVGMNTKPNRDNDHKPDDTGIVGKMLSQLENDKQLDRLAGTPNNKENGGRQ